MNRQLKSSTDAVFPSLLLRCGLERVVEGDVRFIGDNLGATNKVANNTAKILKRSTLPAPAASIPQQTTGKESASTP